MLFIVLSLDFILGDPPNWPHPIRYVGNLISKTEKFIRKNFENLKVGGFFLVIICLSTVFIVFNLLMRATYLIHPVVNKIVTIYFLYTSIAGKCLDVEAKKVYRKIKENKLEESRKALSYLVGRDTTQLNFNQIIRGVVDTVSENTIDGVLAPLMYMIIGFYFNMPVEFVFIYKTINTLDSMVGYTQEPYREIGFASAKLDDIANYIPARLGSVVMLLAGLILKMDIKNGIKIFIRDKRNHKSPNCAYPESVVAGLLQIQLGGTNTYFGEEVYKPTIGDSLVDIKAEHINKTSKIIYMSEVLVLVFLGVINIFI